MTQVNYKNVCKKTLLIAACMMAAVPAVQAQGWTGNINGILGLKVLDEDDWLNFDDQVSLGASFDFKLRQWPVSLTVASIISADTESSNATFANKEKGSTFEIQFGVRKNFGADNATIHPYLGGGIAFVGADLKRRDGSILFEDDDAAVGLWAGGGVYWTIIERINVGFDIRFSKAEVTLFNEDVEAGGLHIGITTGYHWH